MSNEDLLNPDAALAIILESVNQVGVERANLRQALGRTLAEDIRAQQDLPPFANSAMDGYAVVASDTRGASRQSPCRLRVLAEQPAGKIVTAAVIPGSAVRIMTGAALPAGADAVVIVESTEAKDGFVLIYDEAAPGANVRPAGGDVIQGQLVLKAGTRIGPAEMGMLAALGRQEVDVFRKPRVAIITTGDEIVDVSQPLAPGQIRDANHYSLVGQVVAVGADPAMVRRVADEREELAAVLLAAAESGDAIVTSGGVSVGAFDFVKETLGRLGEVRFWRIAMKPGKPLAFGFIAGKPLFGLPGNPVSSMVTFDLFVRPALLRMAGVKDVRPSMVTGVCSEAVAHKPGRREFVRAQAAWSDGRYLATPTGPQGSGRLSSMLNANCYLVIPEGRSDVAAGETVEIILWEWV